MKMIEVRACSGNIYRFREDWLVEWCARKTPGKRGKFAWEIGLQFVDPHLPCADKDRVRMVMFEGFESLEQAEAAVRFISLP